MINPYDPLSAPARVATYLALPGDVTKVNPCQTFYLIDLNILAVAMGDHWDFTSLAARAFADILAIPTTSLATGMICRATDLSLHTFIWDGSNWQSLNNALIKISSSRTAVTLSGATSTNDQLAYSISVPAGLMGVGGKIYVDFKMTFGTSSANEKAIALKTITGSYNIANWASTNASYVGMQGRLTAMFESVNSTARVLATAGTPYPFGTTGGVYTVDTSPTLALGIYGKVGNSSESATINQYDLFVERRAV